VMPRGRRSENGLTNVIIGVASQRSSVSIGITGAHMNKRSRQQCIHLGGSYTPAWRSAASRMANEPPGAAGVRVPASLCGV
jgi:hypothetical protein